MYTLVTDRTGVDDDFLSGQFTVHVLHGDGYAVLELMVNKNAPEV